MAARGSISSSTSSREMTATGLALLLISVGAVVSSTTGGFALLLCFAGVLAGAVLIFVGVRKVAAAAAAAAADEDPTAPTIDRPAVLGAADGAVRRWLRRNLAFVGLLLASSAATTTTVAADGETNPVLCFCGFALLLLGLSLINIGLLLLLVGEEQEL